MADSDVEIVTEVKTNQSYPYDWLLHIDHLQKSNIETRVLSFLHQTLFTCPLSSL